MLDCGDGAVRCERSPVPRRRSRSPSPGCIYTFFLRPHTAHNDFVVRDPVPRPFIRCFARVKAAIRCWSSALMALKRERRSSPSPNSSHRVISWATATEHISCTRNTATGDPRNALPEFLQVFDGKFSRSWSCSFSSNLVTIDSLRDVSGHCRRSPGWRVELH
jgi:hypothetical protein